MPSLADIYSAINTAKRKGADFVQNPGTSLQQMLGNANDQARGFNQLNDQALAEMQQTGKLTGPAGQQLMSSVANSYDPMGITVWHGSPHKFAAFDSALEGTGVGRSAYGSGVNLAESKPFAEGFMAPKQNSSVANFTYKGKEISPEDEVKRSAAFHLMANDGNKEAIFSQWKPSYWETKSGKQFKKTIDLMDYSQLKPAGNLYKVDLPDTHVEKMLDWDSPLKDQSKPVRDLAKKLGLDMNDLGGDLLSIVGKTPEGSKTFQKAGVPGVKYYQISGSSEGPRNYVVFDPNHLTVLERNNQPIK
jgi:hypothetical protein